MAAPTNPRVESTQSDANVVRWTDNGGASNDVYRSTDGSSYAEIAADVALGVQLYTDQDITAGVKYWYKVTNDNGSTFSSAVTVVTQTCPDLTLRRQAIPHFDEGDTAERLNSIAEQVQANNNRVVFIGGYSPSPFDQCVACPGADGELVLDCSAGCGSFLVVVTADINSITLIGCAGVCPPIDFEIAAAADIGICGWPLECDNQGDDCFYGRVAGGSNGQVIKTNGQAVEELP